MPDLNYRQAKIAQRQHAMSFRDFVMHVVSRRPLTFYKNHGVFSHFPPDSTIKTVDFATFSQERSNYTIYGKDWDPSYDFFSQLRALGQEVPYPHIMLTGECENSGFASFSANCKNTYLSTTVNGSENVFYSMVCRGGSNNVYNSACVINNCANIYQSSLVINSQNIFFSFNIDNCFECWMSKNLVGCKHCIACSDIENQSYCIENVPYEKDDFLRIKDTYLATHIPQITHTENYISTSNSNKLSTHLNNALYAYNTHTAQNVCFVGGPDDENNNLCNVVYASYGNNDSMGGDGYQLNSHVYMGQFIIQCHNIYYSQYMENCSFCVGCIGLQGKSYCIFNKQYEKLEWYRMVEEIFGAMEKDGTLGDFLPPTMNHFYFNDTAAYLIDPTFTKEEVTKLGYLRRDESIKVDIPAGAEVVKTSELAQFESTGTDGKRTIHPDILKKIIIDEQGNYYRIVQMEYDFLVKHGLPLPRKHRLDRMKDNFKI